MPSHRERLVERDKIFKEIQAGNGAETVPLLMLQITEILDLIYGRLSSISSTIGTFPVDQPLVMPAQQPPDPAPPVAETGGDGP